MTLPPHKEPELKVTRRRKLPHWTFDESTYFITWRLHKNQSQLEPSERTVIASILRYFDGQRYELFCYVVMNDHVHVLTRPI